MVKSSFGPLEDIIHESQIKKMCITKTYNLEYKKLGFPIVRKTKLTESCCKNIKKNSVLTTNY